MRFSITSRAWWREIDTRLVDEQQTICTITALVLAALAMAATPYRIEAFDFVLMRCGRVSGLTGLVAFLKAIGKLIPLMDESANSYTCEKSWGSDQPRQL